MNTIASLTRSQPDVAEQVTEDLAELFRESLADAGIPSTVGRELEICRQYLRIEEQRLGERLQTEWDVADLPAKALLPRLSLQPLIENAVYHGVEPVPDGGRVTVTGEVNAGIVSIAITNPLPGSHAKSPRQGNKIAQANVSERLSAFFGPRAAVTVTPVQGQYRIVLEFPVVLPDD